MNHKRNNKYYWYTPNSIITVFLISLASVVLSNMHGALAVANDSTSHEESVTDLLDKGNLAEFFDLGTGIFAAYSLCIISTRVYEVKIQTYFIRRHCICNICNTCNSIKTRSLYTSD